MAVRYEISGDLLRLVCEGEYRPDDVMKTFALAMEDAKGPDRVRFLMDVRRSESLRTRSADDLLRIVSFLEPYLARIGGRCAVLVSSDVQFGLGRMSSVFASQLGVQGAVFRDEASALEWLMIPEA